MRDVQDCHQRSSSVFDLLLFFLCSLLPTLTLTPPPNNALLAKKLHGTKDLTYLVPVIPVLVPRLVRKRSYILGTHHPSSFPGLCVKDLTYLVPVIPVLIPTLVRERSNILGTRHLCVSLSSSPHKSLGTRLPSLLFSLTD